MNSSNSLFPKAKQLLITSKYRSDVAKRIFHMKCSSDKKLQLLEENLIRLDNKFEKIKNTNNDRI
jgi:hypothetical protein